MCFSYLILFCLYFNLIFCASNQQICTYQENYEDIINETIVRKVPQPYRPDCSTWNTLFNWLTRQCNVKYKVEDKIEYRNVTVNKSRTRYGCCDGWTDLEYSNCTKPVCEPDCIHGTCVKPYECHCDPGWKGSICGDKCDGGSYGDNCSHTCNCGNGAVTCHHVSGECQCAPGFMGIKCQGMCPQGKFGFGCSEHCPCSPGSLCRASDGFCNCSTKITAQSYIGYNGPTCSSPCNRGVNCLHRCDCIERQGDCNPYTGTCICKPGFLGPRCQHICPSGTFGPSCLGRCLCLNNSTCDTVSGACNCQPGWSGERCENPCQKGRYGVGCSLNCQCLHFESCDALTGHCNCAAGWSGPGCESPCPAGTFGRACASLCNCTAFVADGSGGPVAFYPNPGYTLAAVDDYFAVYSKNVNRIMRQYPDLLAAHTLAPANVSGPLGLLDTTTLGSDAGGPRLTYVSCDPADGRCLCPPGRMGARCEETCPHLRFGQNCGSACECDHAYNCDPATGACNCTLGWHGQKCEIACGKGFYGSNCEKTCECYGAETCHPITGACICPAGKTGINCTEDCSFGWYGIFCQHLCPCALDNANKTQPCDMITGSCNCRSRFAGNCSACETGWFGPGCQGVCPCSDNLGRPSTCDFSTGECKCPNGTSPDRCILVLSTGFSEEMAIEGGNGRNRNSWMTLLFVIFTSLLFIIIVIGLASCYVIQKRRKALLASKSHVSSDIVKKGALPSIPTNNGAGCLPHPFGPSPRSASAGLHASLARATRHASSTPTDDPSNNIYCMDDDEDDIDYAYPTSQFGTVDRKGMIKPPTYGDATPTLNAHSGRGTDQFNHASQLDKVLFRGIQDIQRGTNNRGHLYQELPDRGSSTPSSATVTGPPSSSSVVAEDCYDTSPVKDYRTPTHESADNSDPSVETYNETYLVPLPPRGEAPKTDPGTPTAPKRNYHKLDHSGDSFKILPESVTQNYNKLCSLQTSPGLVRGEPTSPPPPLPSRKVGAPVCGYPRKMRQAADFNQETLTQGTEISADGRLTADLPLVDLPAQLERSSSSRPLSAEAESELYHFPSPSPNDKGAGGGGGTLRASPNFPKPSPALSYNTVVPPQCGIRASNSTSSLLSDGLSIVPSSPTSASHQYNVPRCPPGTDQARQLNGSDFYLDGGRNSWHKGNNSNATPKSMTVSSPSIKPNGPLVRPIPPKKPQHLSNPTGLDPSVRLSSASSATNYDEYDSPGNVRPQL